MDGIHPNLSEQAEREGRTVRVKRRGWTATVIMRVANLFFRFAKNPAEAVVAAPMWQKWEVENFLALHGPEFRAGLDADGAPWVEVLPGMSLAQALDAGTLTPAMLCAAALELRRVHALTSPHYGGAWSHADPHTGNFVYDPATQRARLIDFELRHFPTMPAAERHAEDLLVLLQDVCGRCPAEAWTALARAVLETYAPSAEVTATLSKKLHVPHGIPRLWWAVRTTWMKRPELERRVAEVRALLT